MIGRKRAMLVLILGGLMESPATAQTPTTTPPRPDESRPASRRTVDAGDVARLPQPGSVVPGAFGFTPDGKGLAYLKSETAGPSRILWLMTCPQARRASSPGRRAWATPSQAPEIPKSVPGSCRGTAMSGDLGGE